MRMESARKLFTSDDVLKMAEAGLFGPEERIELIDGEILEMTPVGVRHVICVNRATAFFIEAFGRAAIVSIQNPVHLNIHNMPQPDVVVFKPKADFYASGRPTPSDVLFLVEVSDSTLRRDRNIKLPRFAAYGIPEVWIEDLKHDLILVYRDPEGSQYRTQLTFRRGEFISPLAFPKSSFRVDDLIGEEPAY
jgi:Uma2 family endonuclease